MFTVTAFNTHLVNISKDIDFKEYVKEVNKVSNSNINLSLLDMEDLLKRNECCIPHSYLYTYNLLSTNRGRCLTNDIYNLLKQYKEGIDYVVRHVAHKQGNYIIEEDEYYIHPILFRKMLMQKNRSDDYINYFVFIEDCMYHYTDYRKKLDMSNQEDINEEAIDIEKSIKNMETLIIKIDKSLNSFYDNDINTNA